METISKQYHSASRYYLARASPNHSMTLCNPEQLQSFANQNSRNPKTVARTSSVPPQAECIEMETKSNHDHSASRYYLSRASPNHSMTLCKPEYPPLFASQNIRNQKNSCKDIECSDEGGIYRDGYCILEIMQMFKIETLRVSRGTVE
jgi:hypothetical protein